MTAHHLNIYSLEKQTSFFRHHFLLPLLCIIVNSSHSPADVSSHLFVNYPSILEWKSSLASTGADHCVCAGPLAGAEMLKARESSWCRVFNLLSIFSCIDTHRDDERSAPFGVSYSPLSRSMLDTGQRPQKSMGSNSHFADRKNMTFPPSNFIAR